MTMRNWTFENDGEGLAGEPREQWLIRDLDTDNADIIAVVPKTGDEEYDDKVTYPNVKLMTDAPRLKRLLTAAYEHLKWCGYGDRWERECSGPLRKELDEYFSEQTPTPAASEQS